MKRLKQIWYWYWGDGSTPHNKIMPYTIQFVILVFILTIIYKGFEWLYNLII